MWAWRIRFVNMKTKVKCPMNQSMTWLMSGLMHLASAWRLQQATEHCIQHNNEDIRLSARPRVSTSIKDGGRQSHWRPKAKYTCRHFLSSQWESELANSLVWMGILLGHSSTAPRSVSNKTQGYGSGKCFCVCKQQLLYSATQCSVNIRLAFTGFTLYSHYSGNNIAEVFQDYSGDLLSTENLNGL